MPHPTSPTGSPAKQNPTPTTFEDLIELIEAHAGEEVWPDARAEFVTAYLEDAEGFERELRDAATSRFVEKPIAALRWRVNRGRHRAPRLERRSSRARRSRSGGGQRLDRVGGDKVTLAEHLIAERLFPPADLVDDWLRDLGVPESEHPRLLRVAELALRPAAGEGSA